MSLELRVTARAAGEIERADTWWRHNRPSVPGAFSQDLRNAFTLLLRQPGIGTPVPGAHLAPTRRLHLRRIRYFVYYRVQRDSLVVLAVWHASRAQGAKV